MGDDDLKDAEILASWRRNAEPWVEVVRSGAIESRREATDAAIVEAVLRCGPQSVLDVGCGEGWLARRLAGEGIRVVGIDAVEPLVDEARRAGGAEYHVLSYEAFGAQGLNERFDVVVCNFSLLGDRATEAALAGAARSLAPAGTLLVQTLHPAAAIGDEPYRDGWRSGSWRGFPAGMGDPAPWYFRTLGGWIRLLGRHGLVCVDLQEPVGKDPGKPLSLILVAQRRGGAW